MADIEDIKTEPSTTGPPVQEKGNETAAIERVVSEAGVPSSGCRAAFRDLRRQLSAHELAEPGAQKLLLQMFEEADDDRKNLRSYEKQYHETDKKAAVLAEKLRTNTAIEVFFGVGTALGGAILGLAPYFGSLKSEYLLFAAIIGVALVVGATAGRVVKR